MGRDLATELREESAVTMEKAMVKKDGGSRKALKDYDEAESRIRLADDEIEELELNTRGDGYD